MISQQKRRTLKTITATTAVLSASATPLAWSALIGESVSNHEAESCGVTIKHQWATGKNHLVIKNLTDKPLMIDQIYPRTMVSKNGRMKLELAAPQGQITIPPVGDFEFEVTAKTTDQNDSLRTLWLVDTLSENLKINSAHTALTSSKLAVKFDPFLT